MAPIERFSSENFSAFAFETVVREVCQKHGLLRVDSGGDHHSDLQHTIFSIGANEGEAVAVACVGNEYIENEESLRVQLQSKGTEKRPHVLIAPAEIIDEVRVEFAKKPQRVS